ncbi:hypothetical protein ACROYT_G041640 [Oculina patagonica]
MMSWTAAVGFVFSFGIFFPVFMDYFNEDRERTAWIGSLAIALVFFTGSVSGILVSKFGCRATSLLGAMICGASLAIAPQSNSLVTLYLAYSIPFGIGTSFIFNSGLVIVSNYFSRRRSLALGFVSAGQGMGVLVQGPLLQTLIDNYGWKTTYRIMAGVVFGICLLGITYDPNVKTDKEVENADQLESSDKHLPHQRGQKKKIVFLDVSVWKIPAFVAITLSSAIAQFGHFVPQIHLIRFCEDIGITADKASKLYIYYGIASATARVIAGRICDVRRINPVYVYQGVEFVVGLSTILVTFADSYSELIVFAVFYGFCDGAFITTLNVILLTCVEEAKRPASLGWNMQFASIFMGSGPPIAGLMADRMGSYHGAFYLAGSAVILGAAIPFVLPFTKRNRAHHADEQGQALHPKPSTHQIKDNSQTSDFPCHDNPSFVGDLVTNYSVKEANHNMLGNDVERTMIDPSLSAVNDTVSPCRKGNSCSGNIKSVEKNDNPSLLLDAGAEPCKTDASEDELISNNNQQQETTLQSNTYQIEVDINSQLSTTRNKDNEQETPEDNVNDTKL